MKRLTLLFFLLLGLPLSAEPIALGDGESFKYRVSWGIFPGAGEITISAHAEIEEGLPQLRVITTTATRGLIRTFFQFDADGESLFDTRDGRLLAAKATSAAGKKKTRSMAVFDYHDSTVRYVDYYNPARSSTQPMPSGSPMDLITSLVQTRAWNLKPGERRPAVVMFDDQFYDLVIIADHVERVRTPWGDVQALVLVPTMETNPKGMFKKGGRVRVWISQDERHLPVKFEVSFNFGTGTATLTDYHPPMPAAPPDHANSRP